MNLSLSPKGLFQQNEDQVKAFKAIAHNTHFLQALNSAMSEFAMRETTPDELKGARRFISLLLNIAEKESTPERMPPKKLDHSVLEPRV